MEILVYFLTGSTIVFALAASIFYMDAKFFRKHYYEVRKLQSLEDIRVKHLEEHAAKTQKIVSNFYAQKFDLFQQVEKLKSFNNKVTNSRTISFSELPDIITELEKIIKDGSDSSK